MSTKCLWAASLLAAAISLVSATTVKAQTGAPDSISVQGYLTDTSGIVVPDGHYSVRFRLYRDGTSIWQELHPNVTVEHGVFNELLGGTSALDTMAFNAPLKLGIKVGTDPEISPRTPLAAVPYAKALPGMYTFYREKGLTMGYNVVGGWPGNLVGSQVVGATISGGGGVLIDVNPNSVTGDFGTVGGGSANEASYSATVSGGYSNVASNDASTVSGGWVNEASGYYSTVSGGMSSSASGPYSTVPGGNNNFATGHTSFAAGQTAFAGDSNSFVWSSMPDFFQSTGPRQFLIEAPGGVGIGTNNPADGSQLDVAGAIHVEGPTMLFRGTSAEGSVGLGDGIRLKYDGTFGGPNSDWFVIEKTDANQNNPDGGVAFVNTGGDGIPEVALKITGDGDVAIQGNLSKGGGAFKIDHPLDPTNKFLFHSFVESPDMKNVYDGVITLDEAGEAEVELPSYFEALNRDFRYQLTCVGGFAPVFVSEEITDNRFRISGGLPGMKVSWQVTGIRHDPFAVANPIEVEVDKGPGEQGTYLHPAAYGASH